MTSTICPVCGGSIHRGYHTIKGEMVYCHLGDLTVMLNSLGSLEVTTFDDPGYPRSNSHQRHPNKTNLAKCPLCGEKVKIQRKHHLGEMIVCPACEGALEVIKINPFKLALPHNGHYATNSEELE